MSRRTLYSTALILLLAASVGGCQEDSTSLEPLDAQTATFQLNTHFRAHAEGFAQAITFLDDSDLALGAAEFSGLGGSEGEVICDPEGCVETDPTYSYDVRDDATSLADVFEERVFVAANIESEDGKTVTFLMRPEVVCADPDTSEIDSDCADTFGNVEVRLVATTLGDDDIDMAIKVGSHTPIDLEIYREHIAADIDLAEVQAALQLFMDANAEPGAEQPTLPTLSGALRAELIRDGELAYTAKLHVTRAVSVSGTGTEVPFDLTIAKSQPLVAASFDGNGKLVEASMNAGAIHLGLEGELFGGEEICESDTDGNFTCTSEPGLEGTLAIDIPALHGSMTLAATSDEASFSNIGIGDSGAATASIDGNTLLSAALTPFSITARDADGSTAIDISPMMQLELMLAFKHIQDQLDGAPDWILDDTFTLTIDGDSPSLSLLDSLFGSNGDVSEPAPACIPGEPCEEPTPEPEPEPAPEAIVSVLSGQLSISALGTETDVSVSAGQCLFADESVEGAHLLDMMSTGACP